MIAAVLTVASVAVGAPVLSTTRTAPDGTAILVHELVVEAPVTEVWDAISTAEGWKRWAVPIAWAPAADVIETSYTPNAKPGDPTTIRQQVLVRVPHRLFAFRTIKGPDGFEDFETFRRVENVFELEALNSTTTRVRLTSSGFVATDAGKRLVSFFERGNRTSLAQLGARFQSASAPAAEGPLQSLSFLVGHCWRGEFKGGAVDIHCFESVFAGKHVRDRHEVTGGKDVYRGESLYSWNGSAKRVEYVYWNSLGSVMRGAMRPDARNLIFDNEAQPRTEGTAATFRTEWIYAGGNSYDVVTKAPNSPIGQQVVTYRRVD